MYRSGVYKILNLITNKFYIGSSSDVKHRWSIHKSGLKKNTHHSKILQNAWNKYGEQNFIFEVVELCEVNRIQEREQFYIDSLKPTYNVRKIAESNRGVVRSEEQKQYLSKLYKGKKRSRESIDKQRLSAKGYVKTPEHLAKIKQANIGKKKSRQQCLNQSQPTVVTDTLTQEKLEFESIKATADHFKTTSPFICTKIDQNKLIRNQYLINRKIEENV